MDAIIKIRSVTEANALVGKETDHPLVSVIDFSKYGKMKYARMNLGLYGVFLKVSKDVDMLYGRQSYDYQEGTLVCISPGQVIGFSDKEHEGKFQPTGWGLFFHPDLIHGTSLGKNIHHYNFFSYDVHEALHLSKQEKKIVIDCLNKVTIELSRGIDRHSKMLIVSNLELLLNYCIRFYDRQFITRDNVNRDMLIRFEDLLNDYFATEKSRNLGLPSVSYCAEQLNLSANYFGDLVKKETGKTAQEYIQDKVIEVAKERVFDASKTMSEIAYELGFKYPQHFTRLFKQKVGNTPNEYREMN